MKKKKNKPSKPVDIHGSYQSFGQLLRDIRNFHGLTLKEMAEIVGVHHNSQRLYEVTPREPGLGYLLTLSRATHMPFWQLFVRMIELGKASDEAKQEVLNEIAPVVRCVSERQPKYQVEHQLPAALPKPSDDLVTPEQPLNTAKTAKLIAAYFRLIDNCNDHPAFEVFEHDGDSMSPTIHDGDTMVVDTAQRMLTENDLFVVKIGQTHVAKRVQFLPAGGVLLIADNKNYQGLTVQPKDIDSLDIQGKIISSINYH